MHAKRWSLVGLSLCLALVFAGLGVWQLQRLQWKTELIAQVEARVNADPVAAPGPEAGAGEDDAYRAVRVRGVYRHAAETRVQAVTELGPGYWVMTPLDSDRGFAVLVNRGFVPDRRTDWSRPEGSQTVTGLLRLTEPHGGFLRANDPAGDRWRSRDVVAIAAARGVRGPVAPYFIDASAGAPDAWPRGGLTRVRFSNSHLVYALTWFALFGLCVFGAWRVLREPFRDEA